MRLKNLLTFLVLLSVSLGMRAATISGDGISGVTATINDHKVQTLVINSPGALATWVAAHTGDNYVTNNPFEGLGGSNDFYSLKISPSLKEIHVPKYACKAQIYIKYLIVFIAKIN